MSHFADIIAQGMETTAAVAGEAISYVRGTDSIAISDAVPGTSQIDIADTNDFPISATTRDWIIKTCKLVIAGVVTLPRKGDKVIQTIAGKTTTYEVLSDGNQFYRFCDRRRTRIRIHTKEKNG